MIWVLFARASAECSRRRQEIARAVSAYPRAFARKAQNSCERASREEMTDAVGRGGGGVAAQPVRIRSITMKMLVRRKGLAPNGVDREFAEDRNGCPIHVVAPKTLPGQPSRRRNLGARAPQVNDFRMFQSHQGTLLNL